MIVSNPIASNIKFDVYEYCVAELFPHGHLLLCYTAVQKYCNSHKHNETKQYIHTKTMHGDEHTFILSNGGTVL